MIGTNQYHLTWEHFEQLHPDKEKAFENLCRSLFQRELCAKGTILHSDPNHPGVEDVYKRQRRNYPAVFASYGNVFRNQSQ